MLAALIAGATASATAGAAPERPRFLPARDVAVDYVVQRGESAAPAARAAMRISYAGDGSYLRIDPSGGGVPIIANLATHRAFLLFADKKAYLELPFDAKLQRVLALNDTMHFTRTGNGTIAGLACVEWEIRSGSETGHGCITDDGVMLEGEAGTGKGRTLLRASKVAYGVLPPDLFAPPPGWRDIGRAKP